LSHCTKIDKKSVTGGATTNEVRPHSAIGRIPPAEFAALHRRHAGDARQSPEVS